MKQSYVKFYFVTIKPHTISCLKYLCVVYKLVTIRYQRSKNCKNKSCVVPHSFLFRTLIQWQST